MNHMPEKLKKKILKQREEKEKKEKEKKPVNTVTTDGSSPNSDRPTIEEKKEDGSTWYYCKKCYNHRTNKYGIWQKSIYPTAHKTCQHKSKNPETTVTTQPTA